LKGQSCSGNNQTPNLVYLIRFLNRMIKACTHLWSHQAQPNPGHQMCDMLLAAFRIPVDPLNAQFPYKVLFPCVKFIIVNYAVKVLNVHVQNISIAACHFRKISKRVGSCLQVQVLQKPEPVVKIIKMVLFF